MKTIKNIFKELDNVPKVGYVFSLLFACIYSFGEYVKKGNNNIIRLIVIGIIIFIIYSLLYCVLFFLLKSNKDIVIPNKIKYFFEDNFLLKTWIIILIFWLPHLIAKYPIGANPDSYYQLMQGLGMVPLTTHWPLFHTLSLTYIYKLGLLLGDQNIVMFIFNFIDTLIGSFVFAYCLKLLKDLKTKSWIICSAFFFYTLNPLVCGYIGSTLKDFNYSYLFVLFVLEIYIYSIKREDFWNSKENILSLFLTTIFIILFRRNGIYITLPTISIVLFKELFIYKKNYSCVLIIVLSLIIPLGVNATLKTISGAKDGSKGEILAVPLNITAKLIKENPQVISADERMIIDRILPFDEVGDLYVEYISDPVKGVFNDESTSMDMINYIFVWIKEFFKAPLTYIDGYLRQEMYFVYPGFNTFQYSVDCNSARSDVLTQEEGLFQTPVLLKSNQHYYLSVLYIQHETPIVQIWSNISTYCLIFIGTMLIHFSNKNRNKTIATIPLILSFLILMLSPAIIKNPRYAFPIIYSLPVLLTFVIKDNEYKNS